MKVIIAVFILITLVVLNIIFIETLEFNLDLSNNNEVSIQENLFKDVKKDISINTTVGYIDANLINSLSKEYFLAQYALAPVTVINNVNQKIIIGRPDYINNNLWGGKIIKNIVLKKTYETNIKLFININK